jgi:hypothetical protein
MSDYVPSDTEVDADLMLEIFGFDPNERYPEWGNQALRDAYRAGWRAREDERTLAEAEGEA